MIHKVIKILLGTFIVLPLISCGSKDSDEPNPDNSGKQNVTVSVSPESLNVDYNAQTVQLNINANTDWAIRCDASWVSLRPSGGVKNESITVSITVDANKEMEGRDAVLNIISGSNILKSVTLSQGYILSAYASVSSMIFSGEAAEREMTVTANGDWTLASNCDWLTVSPSKGGSGTTDVKIMATLNDGEDNREGILTLSCGDNSSTVKITQLNYNVSAPEGYALVWNDEFNYEGVPNSDWAIENQAAGWVNNELQTYTGRQVDGKYTLEVKDGFLNINCFRGSDGKIYSGRMNAKPNTGWKYGYVEARINLPSGKGTWPAFWMMPSNVDWNSDPWPYCGEIDIMEEVGVDKNRVSSSVHTGNYNHTIGTQKTHEMYLEGAEGEFHVYALEWDENKLTTYVDGKVQLSITKAALGNDHASWPFDREFYPILNLAWGGDWGGYAGVDDKALPVTMLVDYVRIFQKQ